MRAPAGGGGSGSGGPGACAEVPRARVHEVAAVRVEQAAEQRRHPEREEHDRAARRRVGDRPKARREERSVKMAEDLERGGREVKELLKVGADGAVGGPDEHEPQGVGGGDRARRA